MMQSASDFAQRLWPSYRSGGRPGYHVEGAAADYGAALRDLLQPWGDLYDAWADALKPRTKPGRHADDCRCPRCHPDDCHCRCCIGDADLLVRARLGERRLVPIVIENNQRREREVELELSSWSAATGGVKVTGAILPPTKLTLKPCEEKAVILAIEVAQDKTQDDNNSTTRTPPDVRDCVVFYADFRVVGCDVRPIRIAVAVLPRDCDAFHVDCRCGCC
jgi:hypothetical protein